ncbi:MAG: right-handed parallel beta-helix repeat-containing protein [Saprospiraceae bacterium]|nr:right-handed parallel beta-helix repeat-containing protein [Saprospiraceae bacterium]
MPPRYPLTTRIIICCLIISSLGWTPSSFAQTVIYVDQSATGVYDGTSWGDAFSGLQEAIAAAVSGDEIWVAQGQYVPGDTLEARYFLDKDIHLYGGFAGNETTLDQRDPDAYLTILSGDVQGDDIPGDLFNFRWDNLYTILEITSEVTQAATLDGFIFRGGQAVGDNTLLPNQWGGSIFCQGSPLIYSCRFVDNYADKRGGAIYVQSDHANGMLIRECQFTNNSSNEDGGAIFITLADGSGVFVENSLFQDNRSDRRGGAIAVYNANSHLKGNEFVSNQSRRTGGAVHVQASFNFLENTMDSCSFKENIATRGGALYLVSSSVFGSVKNHFSVTRSDFELNAAIDMTNNPDDAVRGGAIVLESNVNASETSAIIENCTFSENVSEVDGAVLHVQFDGQESSLTYLNNVAGFNQSGGNGPMTISVNKLGEADIRIDSCGFNSNNSINMGSAGIVVEAGDNAITDLRVHHCSIKGGESLQNSGLSIRASGQARVKGIIQDCSWIDNVGDGCISIRDGNDRMDLLFRNVLLESNGSWGKSIVFLSGTGVDTSSIPRFRFENMVIHHQAGGNGLWEMEGIRAMILNMTCAENELPGFQIGQNAVLVLQNTILANLGENELEYIDKSGAILTNGGNIIGDNSFTGWMGSSDLENTDPFFLGSSDFALTSASPAVDFGVQPDSIYPYDLAGNARIQGKGIDAGAYESPYTSSLDPLEPTHLDLWPNPASGWVQISLPNGWSSVDEIRIIDAKGALFRTYSTGSSVGPVPIPLALDDLPTGTFHIEMINTSGDRATGTLIHQSGH